MTILNRMPLGGGVYWAKFGDVKIRPVFKENSAEVKGHLIWFENFWYITNETSIMKLKYALNTSDTFVLFSVQFDLDVAC